MSEVHGGDTQSDSRPSTHTLGIDLGGTKVSGGLISASGEIESTSLVASRFDSPRALVSLLADLVATLDRQQQAPRVGVSVAGRLTPDRRAVAQAVNLGLSDFPLASQLELATGRRVSLINDAQATLLAEVDAGAARGCRDVLLLALGTGVGGAIMAGGRLVAGAHGVAGEIGHTTVDPAGVRCACGGIGCLDVYGSGPALVRFANEKGPVEQFGSGREVTERAAAGDHAARAAIDTLASWIGVGIANAVALLDPEAIVVSGGLALAGDIVLGPIRRALGDELARRGVAATPRVVDGQLAGLAPVLGAARSTVGAEW